MDNAEKTPTKTEIDAVASLYNDAKIAEALQTEKVEMFGAQLIRMAKAHGFTPPRAEKSLRLEGEEWEVTVAIGQSVSVKKPSVEKLFAALKKGGLHLTLFRKLFTDEKQYKLAKGAQKLMAKTLPAGVPPNVRALFAAAVEIKDKAPRLTVKPKAEQTK